MINDLVKPSFIASLGTQGHNRHRLERELDHQFPHAPGVIDINVARSISSERYSLV